MKRLVTGWDIDGVGANFGDSFHNYLREIGLGYLWKSGPTPEPFWDWYKDWGWTSEQFVAHCHAAADRGILFNTPPREGYREAIIDVKKMGHDIVVITDRPFGATPEVSENITYRWFEEYDIPYDAIFFSADKACIPTDTFVDDKLENYDRLVEMGTATFLLNRPWNEENDGRRRINDIGEYVDAIEEISRQGHFDLQLV